MSWKIPLALWLELLTQEGMVVLLIMRRSSAPPGKLGFGMNYPPGLESPLVSNTEIACPQNGLVNRDGTRVRLVHLAQQEKLDGRRPNTCR